MSYSNHKVLENNAELLELIENNDFKEIVISFHRKSPFYALGINYSFVRIPEEEILTALRDKGQLPDHLQPESIDVDIYNTNGRGKRLYITAKDSDFIG